MAMTATDWTGAVGDVWAEEWPRTDRSFVPVDAALLDAAVALLAGVERPHILDVGCGAGATSIGLAARLPEARITGVDLSPALLAAARARGGGEPRCRFLVADATVWADEDGFDLVVSRHGVMFFDDPVAAFANLRRRAAPGAPLFFSCFAEPARNLWASGLARLLPPPAPSDPHAPGPFAFADPGHVAALLAEAGWRDATPRPLDFRYVAGGGEDPVEDALGYFRRIGPTAFALRQLDPADRARIDIDMREMMRAQRDDGEVAFPAAAWLWTARA